MPALNLLAHRIRNLRRYGEILHALVRYGFADVVQEMELDRWMEKGRRFIGRAPGPEVQRLSRAQRLRRVMEDLGPTFVKVGQVLSTRPDLVPQEWADEFRNLQDDCPTIDFGIIQATLRRELGGRLDGLFEHIDPTPLAAASMAQVHRARRRDGRRVVVKVLRPGVGETTAMDMEILATLAAFAEQHFANLGYSPTDVVRELARELRREVDLTLEGKAADRLGRLFADDPSVRFPAVHWDATTSGVLTLEEIEGIQLSRLDPGALDADARRALVANGANAVLRQCMEFGFFHADPHPGNLIALEGGAICFIDCGMTGQLDPLTVRQLADLVAGVVRGDVERVIEVVAVLAEAEPEILEDRAFRLDVADFVERFRDTPLERLDMGRLLREFLDGLRGRRLRCPGDLVLLIKALTTIESVARTIDPQFDMVAYATPHIERLMRRRIGPAAVRRRMLGALSRYVDLVEQLPREARTVLRQLRLGRATVHLEHHGIHRLTGAIEHASRNIATSLILAALFVGSSILVLAGRDPGLWGLSTLGLIGFLVASGGAILLLVGNLRRDR